MQKRTFVLALMVGALALLITPLMPTTVQAGSRDAQEATAAETKLETSKFDSVVWDEKPLKDAMREIAKKAGVNILIDTNQLDEEDYDVTLDLRNLSAKNVLNLALRTAGLTREFADGAIWIIPKDGEKQNATLYTAVHDIRDITSPLRDFVAPTLELRGDGNQRFSLPDYDEDRDTPEADDVIDILEETVAPDQWGNDGFAIGEFKGSLIITATAEVHAQVRDLLDQLRSAQ